MRDSVLTQLLYPVICNKKTGKVENFVVFLVCAHPVFIDENRPMVSFKLTKNALSTAKMAKNIHVEERAHEVSVKTVIAAQNQKMRNFAVARGSTGGNPAEGQRLAVALEARASLQGNSKGILDKLNRMERYLAQAQNLIAQNYGEGLNF